MKSNDSMMLYVHIPFCERKCDYCDFLSMVCDDDTISKYFDAMSKQLQIKAEFTGSIPVSSIFLGGGTPSCVNPKHIHDLMNTISKYYSLSDRTEISMECNPNSIRKTGMELYKSAGINRISIGLQSTYNDELKVLSRLHTYEEFLTAYDVVRKTGFENVNVDLISALPGQSEEKLCRSVERIAGLSPEHISVYSLIIEEGTKFFDKYSDGKGLPDEESDRNMYHKTLSILKSFGYDRYEISNYSKLGMECKHNVGYWIGRPYLGFGISAASYFDGKRSAVHRDLKAYIAGDYSEEESVLAEKDKIEEFMFLGLRLTRGVSKNEFELRFSQKMDDVYPGLLEKLAGDGLIENGEWVKLTEKGLDLANYVMAQFIK